MEYPHYYYDDPTDESSRQERPQRRGIGGYIVTAVVFTIVGALLATILMPSLYDIEQQAENPAATPDMPVATPAPDQADPFPEDEEAAEKPQKPSYTPNPTTRPMPELNGDTPVISDPANPLPDIAEQVSAGVVGIINYAQFNALGIPLGDGLVEQGSGSGFVISGDGYILTNSHVVEDSDAVGVMFPDGTEMEAEIIGLDKTTDVAVLKIEGEGHYALKLGNSDTVRVGEFTIAIGDPTGRELSGTTTFGIISATAREMNIDGNTNVYLQTDAAINPGNSGGPLLNMAGEVIGITSAKTVTASYDEFGNAISAEGLGFAIPINDAMKIATELITKGYVQRPGVGISIVEWDELAAAEYETPHGVLIYSVTKDGPADKAGIRPDDIIVEVNGQPTPSQSDFVAMVKAMQVGDTFTVKAWRSGEYYETTVEVVDLNTLGNELAGGEANYNFYD